MSPTIRMNNPHVLVGFDGFIDEILECVDIRLTSDTYTPIQTLSDFAQRIAQAAGKSGNIEWIRKSIQLGGNAPLLATALIKQACPVHFIGACGKPTVHPLFRDLQKSAETFVSLTDPGYTNAIEFRDGKLFLGKTTSLQAISPAEISSQMNKEHFVVLLQKVDALACVNWTMTPCMNQLWKWMCEILPPSPSPKTFCLIDLADPKKRTLLDLKEALVQIQNLQSIFDVCLSLNQSEAEQVATLLSIGECELHKLSKKIRAKLNISLCVLHTKQLCTISSLESTYGLDVPFVGNPKRLTGAGDNFNAGCIAGYMRNRDEKEALEWATATAQFLIRMGKSPTTTDIQEMMKNVTIRTYRLG